MTLDWLQTHLCSMICSLQRSVLMICKHFLKFFFHIQEGLILHRVYLLLRRSWEVTLNLNKYLKWKTHFSYWYNGKRHYEEQIRSILFYSISLMPTACLRHQSSVLYYQSLATLLVRTPSARSATNKLFFFQRSTTLTPNTLSSFRITLFSRYVDK